MRNYKTETVTSFQKFYSENKTAVEHLAKFGTTIEKIQMSLIIKIATKENTRTGIESLI